MDMVCYLPLEAPLPKSSTGFPGLSHPSTAEAPSGECDPGHRGAQGQRPTVVGDGELAQSTTQGINTKMKMPSVSLGPPCTQGGLIWAQPLQL